MILENNSLFTSRDQAAQQLAEKLQDYRNTSSVVVTTSYDILAMSGLVGQALNASTVFIPREKIKSPADQQKIIGAVCFENIVMDNASREIPGDYFTHQAKIIQSKLCKQYHDEYKSMATLKNKTVIILEDVIADSTEALATITAVRLMKPAKIVVAIPALTYKLLHDIELEADEVIFLQLTPGSIEHVFPDTKNHPS